VLKDGGYTLHDQKGKEIQKFPAAKNSMNEHIGNWIAAIREGAKLNSEIEEGHRTTLLCHLGNIAHRTGRAIKCDAKDGHILDDKEAMGLWKRDYEPGWEPHL